MTFDKFSEMMNANGIFPKSNSDAINVWNTAVSYVENHIIENLPADISDKLSIRDGGELKLAIHKTGIIEVPKVVKTKTAKSERPVRDREINEAPDHY